MRQVLIFFIKGYQKLISPHIGHHCRFIPSCSQYAVLALQKYGALRGGFLAFWRILRCNPFGGSGFDPVP